MLENENYIDTDELYIHKTITVDKGQDLLRIDKFLMNRIENISRNKIQNAIIAQNVLVNNKAVKSNYRVRPYDVIQIVFNEEPVNKFLVAEKMDLNIMYEDNDIAIINKPAGMVVHPGVGNYTGTLVNGLVYHFSENNLTTKINSSFNKKDNEIRPYLVHRIDKNTSGLLVVAKNELAMERLNNQFFYHSISRKYIALVWGELKEDTGTITGHIARSPKNRQVFCVTDNEEIGKHAVTHYTVLERFGYTTLVSCELETGRTHQIRVHFQHIGHPLFADDTYGGDKIVKGTIYSKYKQFGENCFALCNRQALHAKSLGFVHPATNEFIEFESELSDDLLQVIDKWRQYHANMKF